MLGATQVGGSALFPLPAVKLLTFIGCFPELTAQALVLDLYQLTSVFFLQLPWGHQNILS